MTQPRVARPQVAPPRRSWRPARQQFLDFSPPAIAADEIDEVVDTLRSHWITTGPKTNRFQEAFGRTVHAPEGTSLMLNSCTAGLHLALATLGIGPGDEVLVPTLTFAATANVVMHVGAVPVLVDVEPDTLTIDLADAERAIGPRTKAVMVVHYAGHPADMDGVDALAERFGLVVVEDAAHALPADYRRRRVGSRKNLAAFSFYATKNLTTAEGGALTGDPDLLEEARALSLHGMSRDAWRRYDKGGGPWSYDILKPGFKYNMTDMQAALGLKQLEKLDGNDRKRRSIVRRYNDAFQGEPALQTPTERVDVRSAWHLYVLRLNLPQLTLDRNAFIQALTQKMIGVSVHYRPLHRMTFYADRLKSPPDAFPQADQAFESMVSLPLHPGLSDEDVEDVIDAVLSTVEARRA
jgi:dTDP-4-amino-4,6-dideoxygalactose transaminase